MKKVGHPELKKIEASCLCGMKLETLSTKNHINVGICYKCHPFYTGQQRYVDMAGRIEKFRARYGSSTTYERPQSTKTK